MIGRCALGTLITGYRVMEGVWIKFGSAELLMLQICKAPVDMAWMILGYPMFHRVSHMTGGL